MNTNRKFLLFIAIILSCCMGVRGQAHLPPIAQNDSVSVIQPFADTINVTANDSSPIGDSFCITSVYGSPFFQVLNCSSIIFKSDSSAFGNDTAYYVVCNDSQPNLCDTAMVVVNVQRHYTPMMLNNSKWITYTFFPGTGIDPGNQPDVYTWDYYWTTSDTFINDTLYKILFYKEDYHWDGLGQGTRIGTPQIVGYLRQDTSARKVYFFESTLTSESLLYDFNVGISDTLNRTVGDTAFVTSFDYFESSGNYFRRINIGNLNNYLGWYYDSSAWIEGIGSVQGIINPYTRPFGPHLICFSSNGVTIYPNYATDTCAYIPVGIQTVPALLTSIQPNPTTGLCTLQLKANNESLNASVFDITGREVLPLFSHQYGSTFNFNVTSLVAGLYFVKVTGSNGHVGVSKLIKE